MDHTTNQHRLILGAVVILAIVASQVHAARVAWNVDIHQNKFGYPGDPDPLGQLNYANDFHVWGVLESMINPPVLLGQVNFQTTGPVGPPPWAPVIPGLSFENFNSRITDQPALLVPPARPLPVPAPPSPPVPPIIPGGPFYYFDANWSTAGQIPYCTWMHFGLDFWEDGHNIGYWLQGVWTKNGVDPVANPIYGFEVTDDVGQQKIRVQNASGTETSVTAMDVMRLSPAEVNTFLLADLNTNFFDENPEWNQRFVHVPTGMLPSSFGGTIIGPPEQTIASFFDVYLEVMLGGPLLPGEGLIARQHSTYLEPTGDPDFWQYELHGLEIPEPTSLAGVLIGLGLLVRRRRV